jgi:hypothetical protein
MRTYSKDFHNHLPLDQAPLKPSAGSLRAVGYDVNGTVIAETWRNTTGAPAALHIRCVCVYVCLGVYGRRVQNQSTTSR